MLELCWKGGMAFEAMPDSGANFVMDAYPEVGGQCLGPTPLEAFLSGMAACSAMDVMAIMQKKRQIVNKYRVEIHVERDEERPYPRPYQKITIKHILEGEELDNVAVQKAVELSDEKYCTAIATLRAAPTITSEWEVR